MIVYASRTGNVKYICEQLQLPHQTIHEPIYEPFVLFTYTDGIGQVPKEIERFMQEYHALCAGVLVSGNSNFGTNFCKAGDLLADTYKIPLGTKFDLRGTTTDYQAALSFYRKVIQH